MLSCESLGDIKILWSAIATKNEISYLKNVEIIVSNMDGYNGNDLNAIGLTEALADNTGLHFTITFDEVFYDLKPVWQVAVICHEIAHAIRIQEWYTLLMNGQCTVDDWKNYAATDGHDEIWEQIAKEIAAKAGIDPETAAIKSIDFTDDRFFQTQLSSELIATENF